MGKSSDTKTNARSAAKQPAQPFFNGGGSSVFERSAPQGRGVSPFFVQPKLKVGEAGDHYEREADHMADKVVQRLTKPETSTSPVAKPALTVPPINRYIQSKSDPVGKEEKLQKKEKEDDLKEDKIQKKPIFESDAELPDPNVQKKEDGAEGDSAPAGIESNLNASKGSGSALPAQTSQEMGSAFGTDFSGVRVHNDRNAAQMSNALNAQAFTHGNDIYFNSGKYDTSSGEGKHLLAHELTHTVQQGGTVRKASQPAKQTPPPAAAEPMSSEIVNVSSGQFVPSEKVKAEIDKAGRKGLDVRVIVPGVSFEGKIKVKQDSAGSFDSMDTGYMAVLNPWALKIGGLYLRFMIRNNVITGGFVSPSQTGGNANDFVKKIRENSNLLGGLGLKIGALPTLENVFSGNTYKIGFNDMKVEVGGFINANFNLTLENMAKPIIEASADVNVKGVAKGQLKMDNKKDKLTGEVSLAIEYKNFAGASLVKYNEDGSIDIAGKATYAGDKLSGEINFVSTDLLSANNFAKDAIKAAGGKENLQNVTAPPVLPVANEGKKERALAATGQLQFNLTKWFAGTVNVIVDGKGDVTVIGKIAPPGEIELFKQKDYDKELVSLQVEAGYGIPVIGTIGVFAGVSLSAVAYIGPAKIYNIEILGTYSTDPEVQKSIEIAASINISAYAGLRLRAEGGAKLTVLAHDLKLGVGVNADVGVKAYADARPKIGYRDPGEFFISGTAEMVAQPMLGLSGEFFIEVDAPWWSPIDDDKWSWPIGSKEWPLSDPIGLSATMKDYVLGSGLAPDIEFKKPEFDPSKFMTKMVDKQLPEKTGAGKDGQGGFKEDATVPKPEVADKNAVPPAAGVEPKSGKGGSALKDGDKKAPPDPKAQAEAAGFIKDGAKKLQAISGPITKANLRKELDSIEKSISGLHYQVTLEGDKWSVVGSAKPIVGKATKIAAIVTEEDKKAEGKADKNGEVGGVKADIEAQDKVIAPDGNITKEEAEKVASTVAHKHEQDVGSITVIDGGKTWDYDYVQRTKVQGEKKQESNEEYIKQFISDPKKPAPAHPPKGYSYYDEKLDGSKKIRREEASDLFVKLSIRSESVLGENGETGVVNFLILGEKGSNRISVPGKLAKNVGGNPENHQFHHIIPDAVVRTNTFMQIATAKIGYDLDRASNGIRMPCNDEGQKVTNLPIHNGSHSRYNEEVAEVLNYYLEGLGLRAQKIEDIETQKISQTVDVVEKKFRTTSSTRHPQLK